MAKQIFAYTETGNPPPFAFVRYAQAFVREDGFVVIALRDPSGHHVEVAIPPDSRRRNVRGGKHCGLSASSWESP